MSRARSFVHEWIDLVERSGLLVSEPVLHRFFPGGPEHVEPRQQRALLSAWERFQVDPSDGQRQSAWLDAVLFGLLAWPEDRLARGPRLPPSAAVHLPELDQSLRPSAVLTGDGDRFLLGVWRIGADQKPDRVERIEGTWRATPAAKLERWLRESATPFGLLTGGPAFRLVHVPAGLPASWIEFPTSAFFEEKSVLDGFWSLLQAARFFGADEVRLEHFAAESQKAQAELTESLGEQVRAAVEELILALDRADRGSGQHALDIGTGGRIFLGHDPDEIYKAAVYFVMRLVFILFAEERSLLPHGNVFFDEGYGLGRLLNRLEEEKRTWPETFGREADAWPRLLALFRLIFLGSTHPDLPLPVYGGDLFSPTDFPALAALESEHLHIPNRSVYAILHALTFGEAKVGKEKIAQRYSYRNLDVEHIGYLYEGLLDHHAARAGHEPLVKLANGTEVAIRLSELEAVGPFGPLPDPPLRRGRPFPESEKLVGFLAERGVAGGDRGRIESWLAAPSADAVAEIDQLPEEVARRCRPYAGVIQADEVVLPGRLYLTTSSSRRATGTHYTPIQYTRAMVTETLESLVHVGEHGKLDEPRRLRSPRELLDLKVCDPAMGSGAFLVQVIRYLGEKLADSWQAERERHGEEVTLHLPYAEPGVAREDRIPLPDERTDAELWARRLVAERCIYGVDKNPLAVEMAKLSIWLVTLDPQKPFSFVNHALKPGDSLLGISSLGQLRRFSLSGEGEQLGLLEERIALGVQRASQLRQQIGDLAVVTPADVVQKERLLAGADREVRALWALADLLISTITRSKKPAEQEAARIELLARISYLLDSGEELEDLARQESGEQSPFHWPLAFPEVLERKSGGFDAFVGNPPYMGGQKLTGSFGEPYREYLVRHIAEGARGSADLVAYFFLRAFGLLRGGGNFGLLAVNTIAEGDTRQVGLERILGQGGKIYSAHPNEAWPNQAAVVTSRTHVHRGGWGGPYNLLSRRVPTISAFLTDREDWTPKRIKANEGISFIGSYVLGLGFIVSETQVLHMLEKNPRNADVLFPYLNGEDLNTHPEQKPSRWVVNFWDWPEEKARQYAEPFSIVENFVKPERLLNQFSRSAREKWWLFERIRSDLYHAIGRGQMFQRHPEGWSPSPAPDAVLVAARVSRYFSPTLVRNNWVFNEKTVVFRPHPVMNQEFLCSCIPGAWIWAKSSRLKFDLNLSPADALETLPLYKAASKRVDEAGKSYADLRKSIMGQHQIGLTEINNRLHRQTDNDTGIVRIREALIALDRAVASAYGWSDLELGHDFHALPFLAEGDRVRFTIAEKSRREILDRLSQLNRTRHEEELAQERHETKKPTKRARVSLSQPRVLDFPTPAQPTLFPVAPQMEFWEVAEPTSSPASERSYLTDSPAATYGESHEAPSNGRSQHAVALLSWFRSSTDWRSRAEALDALKFSTPEWNQTIQELLDAGLVERTGEKRGTRYRAKP